MNRNYSLLMKFSLTTCILMIVAGISTPTKAQNWPVKPVRMLIGLPPGGGSDPLARALSQRLSMIWGQPVVVDNRPGANTSIATDMVAKSAPDGYTLLFAIDIAFTVNPHLYAKISYDPIRDFTPITQINTFATVLVANPSLPANNIAELISLARSQPGKITYSSIGAGSQMHLLTEMLGNKAKVSMIHIPYKGIPQMMMATIVGEVNLSWVGVFTVRPQVAAGKLKAIGYGASKRTPFMPDLPTFAEAGYPDVDMSVWYGIVGPAGMSRPLVDRIHKDILTVINDPEFRNSEITNRAYEASGLGPDEFAALIKTELAARSELVRISGAKVE
jgi:tripartite-type tricarboxylate transporter receptor subunit TctC